MRNKILMALLMAGMSSVSANELLEIKITSGVRSEQNNVAVPARIEVISRDEIESSGSSHVADLLRGRGSVQLTDTFGDGSRTNISMRGFGETANANTLVLVDGRRLNNMDIASPDLNSISLKDVERVEIIQGSATVLYGDQAVGGVINIITRQISEPAAYVDIGAGSFGSNRMQAELARPLGERFAFRVSGEKRHSGGYREHNELDYENLFGVLEYRFAGNRWFMEMQSTDENLHTPGALYLAEERVDRRQARTEYQNDYIDTQTEVFRTGLSHALTGNWRFEGEWTHRVSNGEFLQSSRNAAETIPATQDRQVNSFNPRLIGRHDYNGGEMISTIGYDYDESRYRLQSRFGLQNGDQEVNSLYGQVVIPLTAKVKTTLGMRHSRVENYIRDGFTFPAGVDLSDNLTAYEAGLEFSPSDSWRLYVRSADNFRFAKVDEYLNPVFGTTTIINNQTGRSFELGAEYRWHDRWLALSVYQLTLDDEIVFDPTAFNANINLDKTRRKGVTVNAGYQLQSSTTIEGDISLIDAEVMSGTFAGRDVPMVADYTARLGIRHGFNEHWNIYGEVQSVGSRPYSGDFNNLLSELDGYSVLNLNVNYQRKQWQMDLRVNNLLNREYADFGVRHDVFLGGSFESVQPSPERNFWLSLRYNFD